MFTEITIIAGSAEEFYYKLHQSTITEIYNFAYKGIGNIMAIQFKEVDLSELQHYIATNIKCIDGYYYFGGNKYFSLSNLIKDMNNHSKKVSISCVPKHIPEGEENQQYGYIKYYEVNTTIIVDKEKGKC